MSFELIFDILKEGDFLETCDLVLCRLKYNIDIKKLFCNSAYWSQYGDLAYKFKRNVGKPSFSDQLKKIIKRYKIMLDTTSLKPCESRHAWL